MEELQLLVRLDIRRCLGFFLLSGQVEGGPGVKLVLNGILGAGPAVAR
jgi:hypothetical protein